MIDSFSLPFDSLENSAERPFSSIFKDRYHSDDGAFEEARHVFIEANELSEKLTRRERITIGELGFGFGVSFLETCRFLSEFNIQKNTKHRINYFSVEGFPQTKESFQNFHTALGSFQDSTIASFLLELISQYPKRVRGVHRLFISDAVTLTLAYHPVDYIRNSVTFQADCWYLDGFSPSKNSDMWDEKTFTWVYRNTIPDGTFSTYSVSESIQSAARSSGFQVKKIPGFGRKTHMLLGIKRSEKPAAMTRRPAPRIAIIGAGLAGAAVTYALAKRGISVEVFEKEHAPALKASGNKAAVFMPHLSSVPDNLSRYYLAGYLHSLGVFNIPEINELIPSLKKDGVLRLSNVKKWKNVESRLKDLGISDELARVYTQEEIFSFLKITSKDTGIYFPESGSIHPAELVTALLKKVETIHFNSRVISVKSCDGYVELEVEPGTADSPSQKFSHLVFANAYELSEFPCFSWLPFEKIKGQLFTSRTQNDSEQISVPLCYDGYTVPLRETNELLIGATYEHNAHETGFSDTVQKDLISRLHAHFPEVHPQDQIEDGRVCFRTSSPDRFPMIGMLPDRDGTSTNIFTSIGHGSHGTTSCLLAGEILASMILDEPLPVEDEIMKELLPERFLARMKRRNKTLEEIYPASYVWRK